MKPCIILARPAVECVNADHYDAFQEDGRKIISMYSHLAMTAYLASQGYLSVPLNSRCGRTITDKLEGRGIR